MVQNKFSFESERLVVDYLSFNITGCKDAGRIANYLSDSFGFNSVVKETFQGKSEDLIFKITNGYKVSFIKSTYNPESNRHWTGLIVRFSGENGEYFYSLVQKKLIDWSIFDLSCTNIGRLDLYYFRKSKSTDQDDLLELFMENFCEKVNAKSKRKKASWKRTSRGLIMRIGNRSNSNYYRVYQKHNGLQFELELKNQLVKSFQKLLFDNSIQKFEDKLSKHFYWQSFESLNLNSCYMDWLLHWYRQSSPKQNTICLLTTYLKNDNKELTFNFLRFLSFLQSQTKKSYTRSFDDQVYYMIRFPLSDFILYIGADYKSHYQRKKALQIFKDLEAFQIFKLQTFTLEDFDDFEFCTSVIIPYLKVKKNGRLWTVNLFIR